MRAGLGIGILAEMAVTNADHDLRALRAPDAVAGCITWAVLPRSKVLRSYTLTLLKALAPQLDPRELRQILEGNLEPRWPTPPDWTELSQPITQ